MKNIIVIAGPTGVGKTKLSVELAKLIDAEIINADSMQVYKDLNIGTAKINEEEKQGIIHHLFDIADVTDMYTIYDYQRDGRKIISNILNKNKKIIIVGGSGLYIKSLLYNYELKEEKVNDNFDELSNQEILDRIKKYNENCSIHLNNRKRLIRTLNKYINNTYNEDKSVPIYDFTMIGLTTSREKLYDIINKRVDKMINDGLILEVKKLYDNNIYSKSISTGIGYKELYRYFNNEINLDEAIELIKKNSRHYAKRQYTFFNNQFNIKWFETNYDNFDETINKVYEYIKGE